MVSRPRGTRDFGPGEMARRQWAARRMRGVLERFGYREVQTPTFEELELFTAKSGEGIVSELYDFQDKAGRKMALRPELTAPVMRMYHAEHAFDPKPVKWFYFGSCFRYDRPQAGRYREFWQFGCELIGAGTPLAHAELVAVADALFESVGLQQRDLALGHVRLLRGLVDRLGLPDETRGEAMRLIDKKDRQGIQALTADPEGLRRLQGAMEATTVEQARAAIGEAPALDELDQVMQHLEAMGVTARIDLGIARGLDYYTGIVFECHSPVLGAQSQLLGGGGYDLSEVFGAQPTPTLGFGLGFDRTLVALAEEGMEIPTEPGPRLYVGALGATQAWVSAQVQGLRRAGVAVEMDLLGRKPGQIAKAADAAGARFLAIVGDRDMESGRLGVKDLASGETQDVALEDLQPWVLQRLGLQLAPGA